ncbi:MAG: hypothetical protein KGI71_04970 [Patescibacteria group bacterium]|nr:hypothetical protein [Patescibacteria group bacterium]
MTSEVTAKVPNWMGISMGIGAVLPYLFSSLLSKEKTAMTAMEKAYSGLLVLVLQQLERLDRELASRPLKADYDALAKESARLAEDNERLRVELKGARDAQRVQEGALAAARDEIVALRGKKRAR